jgi:hypothetical protein
VTLLLLKGRGRNAVARSKDDNQKGGARALSFSKDSPFDENECPTNVVHDVVKSAEPG